ncbi:MAG: hypothetical protein KF729_15515 [Sandaracinaceae bacterium]|nr:hypothetical protein [Sandaracinaceae bacterium]
MVFIGGATTELFITDPAAPEIRSTLDVDVVVEAASYAEYVIDVAAELRALGAHEDASEGQAIAGHLPGDAESQGRADVILERIGAILRADEER